MASENETVMDVCAEWHECIEATDPSVWNDERIVGLVKTTKAQQIAYLDRIEAAWKREARAIATEHAVLPAVCINKWSGNAAATREALETIHDKVNGLDEECGVDPVEIRDLARAAISAPPRQCDVGTAEEHAQRFYNFCESNSSGINGMCKPTCPCIDCFDKCQCFAKWAQMPYEDEEGGAK